MFSLQNIIFNQTDKSIKIQLNSEINTSLPINLALNTIEILNTNFYKDSFEYFDNDYEIFGFIYKNEIHVLPISQKTDFESSTLNYSEFLISQLAGNQSYFLVDEFVCQDSFSIDSMNGFESYHFYFMVAFKDPLSSKNQFFLFEEKETILSGDEVLEDLNYYDQFSGLYRTYNDGFSGSEIYNAFLKIEDSEVYVTRESFKIMSTINFSKIVLDLYQALTNSKPHEIILYGFFHYINDYLVLILDEKQLKYFLINFKDGISLSQSIFKKKSYLFNLSEEELIENLSFHLFETIGYLNIYCLYIKSVAPSVDSKYSNQVHLKKIDKNCFYSDKNYTIEKYKSALDIKEKNEVDNEFSRVKFDDDNWDSLSPREKFNSDVGRSEKEYYSVDDPIGEILYDDEESHQGYLKREKENNSLISSDSPTQSKIFKAFFKENLNVDSLGNNSKINFVSDVYISKIISSFNKVRLQVLFKTIPLFKSVICFADQCVVDNIKYDFFVGKISSPIEITFVIRKKEKFFDIKYLEMKSGKKFYQIYYNKNYSIYITNEENFALDSQEDIPF